MGEFPRKGKCKVKFIIFILILGIFGEAEKMNIKNMDLVKIKKVASHRTWV